MNFKKIANTTFKEPALDASLANQTCLTSERDAELLNLYCCNGIDEHS